MKAGRNKGGSSKVEVPMAPMIDVVFQLLIFFMLTLKIIKPEGDFNINMPIGKAPATSDDINLPPFKVRLIANADGSLSNIQIGRLQLGNDSNAFLRLNAEVAKLVGGGAAANPYANELEIEVDSDYGLEYQYTLAAVSACTGYVSPQTNQVVRYVEKIKLAPPRRPGS